MPKGVRKFYGSGYLSEDHEKYISPDFFELVGSCSRHPRYKNKRGIDPQVKIFLDQENIVPEVGWNLPMPNQDAAYKSLAKYGKSYQNMTPEAINDLNLAWEWMERQFHPYMRDSRVVTLDEAIQRLDMSSGSGCPFNEEFSKKRDLFEKDHEILAWLVKDWELLAIDKNWKTVFSSSLKEELRPEEKIAENSIRTFAAGAVDATVHGNRLFVDMNEKMYDSHLKTASAIGMTPLKGNWEKLYQKLSIFQKGYALDESQYDSSLREFLMWGCAKFRWGCLRSEDRTPANLQRIQTYYSNLINTLMLTPEGILILKKTGNPSGSVNTVTDNTLILYWIMAFAWIQNAPKEFKTYQAFEMNTAKALLGDDNTWTVSDEAHCFYNAPTVIETWKKLGITTTTDCLLPRLPEDLDFLSAHTVFLDGDAIPLYDRNKLMQAVLYAPQEHLTPETTLTRVTCLLQIGWSDPPFRKFCRSLIQFLLEEYDDVLKEDGRWIMAKCQIQSDEFYYKLFTGKSVTLYTQGCQEVQERLVKPDKETIMASNAPKNAPKRTRRRKQRQGGPKKGVATAKKVAGSQRTGGKRRARRARPRGNALGGRGNTKNFASQMMNRRGCTISEDEFIVAVVGSVNFATTQFSLNPGQVGTFPWLSQEAKLWERYKFEFLEFYYKRDVSEFATNGTTGKVMFSVDFDAADAPPATKTQVEDTYPHADAMPSENFKLTIPVSMLHPKGDPKYVRTAGLPGATDIRLYDAGNLFVSTQGNQNTSEVGELRVRYRVKFEAPVLENQAAAPTNNSISMFAGSAEALVTTVDKQVLAATAITNGLGIVNTAGSFVLPPGNYLVDTWANFSNSGANFTNIKWNIQKNGSNYLLAGGDTPQATLTAATEGTLPLLHWITSNGTDAYTFIATATFGAGTGTVSPYIRFTAM